MPNFVFAPRLGQEATIFAFETVTVAGTAIGGTSATYAPATYGPACRAFITVETASIRWRCDGTAPTASVGHLAVAGDSIEIEGIANVANFKAIRVTDSAAMQITYSRLQTGA